MGRHVAAGHRRRVLLHALVFRCARIPYMVKLDEGKLLQVPEDVIRPLPCFFEELLDDDLQNMIVWATTEGGAVKPAAALRGVNKKLRTMVEETRTWHDQYVDMWMERNKLEGTNFLARYSRRAAPPPSRRGSRATRLPSSGRSTMAGRKSRPRRTR